jgi:flagellar motor switch protein FliM
MVARPFSELESRLIDKAVKSVLPELTASIFHPNSLRMTQIISDSSLLQESQSNEAVALISYEIICGPSRGLLQLCVPWTHVAHARRSAPLEAAELQELMRSGARKVPVIATARVTQIKLSARDLAGLRPGDVLLTEAIAQAEMSLEVGGREIFRGTPGQVNDRRVLRLTVPVNEPQTAKTGGEAT